MIDDTVEMVERIICAINSLISIGEYAYAKILLDKYSDFLAETCLNMDRALNGEL